MKKLILFIGVAAFAAGTPAVAQQGNAHGKQVKSQSAKTNGKAQSSNSQRRNVVTTRDGGRLYAFNARGTCPPGLAKKNNGCMAPGQAKKHYNIGQRYNRNFGNVWRYDQIPNELRTRYQFDQADRYYYRDGYLYQVDPRTMLVRQVISALLR
jgi:Ni/Co efflux regulator RcnB